MKLNRYLTDKRHVIGLGLGFYFIMLLFFGGFQVPGQMTAAFTILFLGFFIGGLLWDYLRKRGFYNMLVDQVEKLDRKYLILEMLSVPEFYEGEILYQELYKVNKSMAENVNSYKRSLDDFKDYIEMWIHEVKIPISALVLMCHNCRNLQRGNVLDKDSAADWAMSGGLDVAKLYDQVKCLDGLIDQVLYYVRAEHAEKDYLIKDIQIKDIVKKVAMHNKDWMLEGGIDFTVDVDGHAVTDAKWLEFILNQLVNNSLKYRRSDIQPEIHIYTEELSDSLRLVVRDNGIGIPAGDLPRVFDKSFTGENGRTKVKSTGMGLYIAKKLCSQLGHGIDIESEPNQGTRVVITILKNDFYKMDRKDSTLQNCNIE